MAFIPNASFISDYAEVNDTVMITKELEVNTGTFTPGHKFVVTSAATRVYSMRCVESGYVHTDNQGINHLKIVKRSKLNREPNFR